MEERAATATWSQQQKSRLLRGTAGESYFVLVLQNLHVLNTSRSHAIAAEYYTYLSAIGQPKIVWIQPADATQRIQLPRQSDSGQSQCLSRCRIGGTADQLLLILADTGGFMTYLQQSVHMQAYITVPTKMCRKLFRGVASRSVIGCSKH